MNQQNSSASYSKTITLSTLDSETLAKVLGTPSAPRRHHGPAADGTKVNSARSFFDAGRGTISITNANGQPRLTAAELEVFMNNVIAGLSSDDNSTQNTGRRRGF